MLNAIKRWWLRVQLKELDEAYSFNYVMFGYYRDEHRLYEIQRRALRTKISSLK